MENQNSKYCSKTWNYKKNEKVNNFLKKELINNTKIKNAYFSSRAHLYGNFEKTIESTALNKTNCKTLFLNIIKLTVTKENKIKSFKIKVFHTFPFFYSYCS